MWSHVKEKALSKQMPFSYPHLKMHSTDSVHKKASRHLRSALKGPKVRRGHRPETVCLFLLNDYFQSELCCHATHLITSLLRAQSPQNDGQIPRQRHDCFLRHSGFSDDPLILPPRQFIFATPTPGGLNQQTAQTFLSHGPQFCPPLALSALPHHGGKTQIAGHLIGRLKAQGVKQLQQEGRRGNRTNPRR